MDQWVRHLPQENKDLNLDSQDLFKDGPAERTHGCNHCAYGEEEVETAESPEVHG